MTRRLLAAGLAGLLACACSTPSRHPSDLGVPPRDGASHGTLPPSPAPKAIAVVQLQVASFEAWKPAFDDFASARAAAGIAFTHVNRAADDANGVTVCLGAESFELLQAFLDSPERAQSMQRAGVVGRPTTTLWVPVEDQTVRAGALAGAFVRHRVVDFDAWKIGFDARAEARRRAGIVGHAIDRGKDDRDEVLVYLQADSSEALQRFTGSADLRDAMQKGGVIGPPEIALVQGLAYGR